MAGMYAGQHEPEEAKREYRAAIALDPHDPEPYYDLGMLHQGAGEWEESFATFEAGVKATGDLASLYQIGRTGVFSGEWLERAVESREQYIASEPDSNRLPSEGPHSLAHRDDLRKAGAQRPGAPRVRNGAAARPRSRDGAEGAGEPTLA